MRVNRNGILDQGGIPLAQGAHSPDTSGDAEKTGVAKIARECARGAFVLGSALGSANAVYARVARHMVAGSVPAILRPAVAAIPALGVGATAVSDAVSAQALGGPTDPEGRSSKALVWVAPVVMGAAFAAYRYAPIKKPQPGSLQDMAAQVLVSAVAGSLTYTTREWMAQRALREAGKSRPATEAGASERPVKPGVADRLAARSATQVLAVVMRARILAQPSLGSQLYLPALVASCAPYGWRDDLAMHIAKVRNEG